MKEENKNKYYWHSLPRFFWKYLKSLKPVFTYLTVFILLFLLSGCGRKMDPTLEDYLQPEPVNALNLTAYYDKIIISWNYPEKNKAKLSSFLLERESSGQVKSLGYFTPEINSFEDKNFTLGQTYRYRIFAINKKGVYSKPLENQITPRKLPELSDLQYKITNEGVILSWKSEDSVMYNIYKVKTEEKSKNRQTQNEIQKQKIGTTDRNYFLIEENFKNQSFQKFLIYLVTPYISESNIYIEGKGTEIKLPIENFIPSKPEEVFWTINENGVYISWKEVSEKWIMGYRVYRKTAIDPDFILIGEPIIPLFFDVEYNINNLKSPVFYRISSKGPLKESEPVEIKVEVIHG
ncbi:hypothetical protein [Thermodesulfovibrio sp. TK110]